MITGRGLSRNLKFAGRILTFVALLEKCDWVCYIYMHEISWFNGLTWKI